MARACGLSFVRAEQSRPYAQSRFRTICVIELSLSRGGEDAEDESIVHGSVDTKTRLQLIGERLDGVGLLMFAPMDPRRRREVRLQIPFPCGGILANVDAFTLREREDRFQLSTDPRCDSRLLFPQWV